MGLFDRFKKKKSQSELMLKASENFLKSGYEIESNHDGDIMDKLKDVMANPSEYDPRYHQDILPSMESGKEPNKNTQQELSLPLMQGHENKINPEDIPSKIDYALHHNNSDTTSGSSYEDILYELRTIKSQNDLIIDMLRQIQRKLNM